MQVSPKSTLAPAASMKRSRRLTCRGPYKYGKAVLRLTANYTGEAITAYSTNEALRLYRKARALLNVSTSYALRPGTELFCNIENVFDEPQEWYRYKPERHQASNFNGTAVFFGVNGRL
jgi:outer membrane receptor protein involved in Fe transport